MTLYEKLINNKYLFDLYTAKQEYGSKRDHYNRFIYQFSNNRDVFNPLVSNYLIKKGVLNVDWPDNHKFAACLTHDIDCIYPTWKYALFTGTKYALKLKPGGSLKRLLGKIKKDRSQNPFWNFKDILQIEELYGGKSSFYFKATTRDPVGWIYDVEILKDEIGYITDRDFEVGLHGGFYSYNDPKELEKEKEILEKASGKKIIGIRMHYLRFDVPNTWKLLAGLGFKYDTTFGYSDMPGFRNGMVHPFRPYDLDMDKEIDILEIPLTVMDGSLFKMGLEEAWTIIKELIEVTEKNKGVITILWHNTTFDEIFWNGWSKLYSKILQLLKEKNAWTTSAEEVYNYWTKI